MAKRQIRNSKPETRKKGAGVQGNKKYIRILDANLNRCREGIRVVEDSARFVMNDKNLYLGLRVLRHKLDKLTRNVYPELLEQRNARSDGGRVIGEGKREDFSSIIAANFRRIEESLRVLEEYGRLLFPEFGPEFKRIRFAAYAFEKRTRVKASDSVKSGKALGKHKSL